RRSETARARTARHGRPATRSRYARHLVFQRPVAVFDLRLARTNARTRALVSEPSDDHRPRDYLLVGRAHGDARPTLRRPPTVHNRVYHAARVRYSRAQDEQIGG